MCIVWFSFIHPTKCNTVRFVAKNINKGFKKPKMQRMTKKEVNRLCPFHDNGTKTPFV